LKVKSVLAMNQLFDILFIIDDNNHQTKLEYDSFITAKNSQNDNEIEYR
jgi:hypothetical protein